MQLTEFNSADDATAAETVAVWARIPAWAEAVAAARPYATVDAVAERADTLARAWSRSDLDAALAHHPRIGARVVDAGAEADASRREQAAMSTASDDITAAIAHANADYEERFGRVFLSRAPGRSAVEMLGEARRRLTNDDETEAAEALGQLREIALLRLRTTLED